MTRWSRLLFRLVLCTLCACAGPAEPPAPAHYSRVVTLAPNLAELVYAAGAGGALVGVSAYSDFPPQALDLPRIGDAFAVDQEQLALLAPDLLLAWDSGTPAHVVDELRGTGYRVEVIRTRGLADVATALRRIGELTGYTTTAEAAARDYSDKLAQLARDNANAEDISVFYQVSARPLYTVNGNHYVSELIGLCGGTNVFADLGELAPTVDVEAVVDRDPEVLLASSDAGTDAFAAWQRWPHMAAERYHAEFLLPADEIGRATPRLVSAGRAVCDALQLGRARRAAYATGGS